jgi:hypothetical protein
MADVTRWISGTTVKGGRATSGLNRCVLPRVAAKEMLVGDRSVWN